MTLARRSELRAPSNDGESLQVPAFDCVGDLVARNRASVLSCDLRFCDSTLFDFRNSAQQELLELASKYTGSYCESQIDFNSCDGIVLSGHQPELFHPGVWYKNFALSAIGCKLNLAAINLVIDTEVCQSTSIKVPSGTLQDPHLDEVRFDRGSLGAPYEATKIADANLFRNFPEEVARRLADFGIRTPLCQALWPHVLDASKVSSNIGFALAAGRHRLEQEIGLRTLEVPLSTACRTRSFAIFAAHLLQHLPRFVEVYNAALAEYRKRYKLRSKTHPAPALSIEETVGSIRFETPFWIWNEHDPQRRPLFVSQTGDQLVIEGEAVDANDVSRIADRVFALNQQGTCIRSRALITTMYARLILSDLFIHGIGGAKYDEVCDDIIRKYFGIEPPDFVVLSATHHLPIETPEVSTEQLREIEQQIREVEFHPERYLDADGRRQARELTEQKKQLFATEVPVANRKERHLKLESVNESLRNLAAPAKKTLQARHEQLASDLARKEVLASREFSFCLFPPDISGKLQQGL